MSIHLKRRSLWIISLRHHYDIKTAHQMALRVTVFAAGGTARYMTADSDIGSLYHVCVTNVFQAKISGWLENVDRLAAS